MGFDEFVDLEICDECGGSGIQIMCDYCHDQRDREQDDPPETQR